jgi:hypothetical protein
MNWVDFAYPVVTTGLTTLSVILLGSLVGALVGCSVVIAERHRVPFGRLAPWAAGSLLLLLFYPKQISQASLTYLLTLAAGAKFAQSIWGLMIISIPASAGIAYLMFSTTITLTDYARLPAVFIKNSGRAPFLRTCLIALEPLRNPLALAVSLLFCTITFQAALLGRTGANTMGSQIQKGLAGGELSDGDRVILLGTAILFLITMLISIYGAIHLAVRLGVCTAFALKTPARGLACRVPSNAQLIRLMVSLITLGTLVVSALLHIFLVLRLFGLAHSLGKALGLPAGSLETTLPSIAGVPRLLENVADPAILGAVSGFALTMVAWFLRLARVWPAPPMQATLTVPIGLACLAFLPSSFAGALSLALPGLGYFLPYLLFAWGALSAGGLASLLVVAHLVASDTQRYANVDRTKGRWAAFFQFLREYGLVAIGILFAVMLGNIFDGGYRAQMGQPSLGTEFLDRQGYWDPARRALALLVMVFALVSTWVLSVYARRDTDAAQQRRGAAHKKWPAVVVVMGLLATLAPPAAGQENITYDVVDLTSTDALKSIDLDSQQGSVEIHRIKVGQPMHSAATKLKIELAQGVRETKAPVDVKIGTIEANGATASRLIIAIGEGVRIRRLEVMRKDGAATDPTVEIEMANRSSVGKVELNGGRYSSILLRPNKANLGPAAASAEIALSQVKLSNLIVVGQDASGPEQVKLTVDAELVPPLYGEKGNKVHLDNLLLRGNASMSVRPASGLVQDETPQCNEAGRLVSFNLSRIDIGDERGRLDQFGTSSRLDLKLERSICMTLLLQDIRLFGNVEVRGGVLNLLAIDNVSDYMGGQVTLGFTGVQRLNFGTASLNQLQLEVTDQDNFGVPKIGKWGYVRVNESLSLPKSVYQVLATSLNDTSNDTTATGIRNFLVDVRWKSFSSEQPNERVASDMLMAVLSSDAREIFGPNVSGFLWFTTGYGKNLWLPGLCLSLLLGTPFLVSGTRWVISCVRSTGPRWASPGPYYSALIAGDNTALLSTSPNLKYVVAVHRLLIAIEIGLVTLFIQNAVLTGT